MSGRGKPRYGDNTHKNVTLRNVEFNGFKKYRLIGPEGEEIEAFNTFQLGIAKLAANTQKNYCYHIADLYDFLFEASYHFANIHRQNGITTDQLRGALSAWDDYLVNGLNSPNETAVLVAQTLPSPLISSSSSGVKHAALATLLTLSHQVRSEQESFVKLGFLKKPVDLTLLFPQINRAVQIDRFQRRKMLESSMLAGVIAGGVQNRRETILRTNAAKAPREVFKAFPFDQVANLVDNCSTYRDKTIYSLYAASGCRQHEGLQLLWSDIDIKGREIKLINPSSRPRFHETYAGLTNAERQRLTWKARKTADTRLIEPFASMFFTNLEQYLRHEYIAHGDHEFVFQHLTPKYAGRPYFLSTQETRSQAFKIATRGLMLPPEIQGPHSLRHMYGFYVVNYLPLPNGDYGLPIQDVQRWMGHANVKETEGYAVKDKQLQRAKLEYANAQVYQNKEPKTLNQLKIEALKAQIAILEQQTALTEGDNSAA